MLTVKIRVLADGVIFYLEAAIVRAEFLSQHSVIGVKGFLLQAAVHQHVNNLPLLLVLQAHPSTPNKDFNAIYCKKQLCHI